MTEPQHGAGRPMSAIRLGISSAEAVLVWTGAEFVPDQGPPGLVRVADSWLVDDGHARAVDQHYARFAAGCRRQCRLADAEIWAFLGAVPGIVPRHGRWFPRVDCVEDAGGQHRLLARRRRAPLPSDTVILTCMGRGDPRACPAVKGPDLEKLAALRRTAQAAGAGEAVLVDADGAVIEGALSSIVWWRGDCLCLPDDSVVTLDSVTRRLIVSLAGDLGVQVRAERASLESLDGLEIWTLSALHGIRPVVGWRHPEVAVAPPDPVRSAMWRCRLAELIRPFGQSDATIG